MASEKKKYVDHFYSLLGNGRSSSKRTITIKESKNSLLLSTDSNFHDLNKKTETYPTLIQMLKSDLFQIQDMINSNSKDIKMFKLLSKTPGLSKKLTEIEQNKSMADLIEKITDLSQRSDKISKIYGVKDSKQLIQKIFLELNLYELLLGKIHDFFILMKLSMHKDDTYQETMSKIISMKDFVEKTTQKLNEKNNNKNNNEIKEIIYKIKNLTEFVYLDINDSDKFIKDILVYIIKLINNFFQKKNKDILDEINIEINLDKNKSEIEKFETIQSELINLIKKYKLENEKIKEENENFIKKIEELENQNLDIINLKSQFESEKNEFLEKIENSENKYTQLETEYNTLKEQNTQILSELNELKEKELNNTNNTSSLENELNSKNEQITILEKSNSDLINKINELNAKILELTNKIKDLEAAKNKNIEINKSLQNSEVMQIMKNYESQLKKIGTDLMNQNKTELKNLENKLKSLQTKYDMVVLERESLKRNIIYLKGKKYDPDSYEEVLKEQFETMRNAFVIKIDELNEELNDIKRDSRVRIYQLELELKENVKLKNNFLKQIISLQTQLDALNKEEEE